MNRVTRAVHFFESGQNIAESSNYNLNWSLHIIQGAGHNLIPNEDKACALMFNYMKLSKNIIGLILGPLVFSLILLFFEADGLKTFDCVIANPPFSLKDWGAENWAKDPFGRNFAGVPPKGNGDMAWIQHMVKSMICLLYTSPSPRD